MIDTTTPISNVAYNGTAIPLVGGGDTPPTTIAELYSKVDQLYEDAVLDSYNTPVPTSIIYTNQPVTLYTPNANCTHYFIFRNSSNKFGIVWFDYYRYPNLLLHSSINLGDIGSAYLTFTSDNTSPHLNITYSSSATYFTQYVSQDRYDTVAQAITAIQSDQTTYRTVTGLDWQNSYQDLNTYSNTTYSTLTAIDNNISLPLTFYELAKISENETIEVIQ